MLQFGRRLAYHGLRPTLVTTRHLLSTLPATTGPFRVAAISDGFDAGGIASCPDIREYTRRFAAVDSETPEGLFRSEAAAGRPVRVLVYDPHLPWARLVVHAAGVPTAAFFSQPCAVDVIYGEVWTGRVGPPVVDGSALRGLLSVELGPEDVPSFVKEPESYPAFLEVVVGQFEGLEDADDVFVNSFHELEQKVEEPAAEAEAEEAAETAAAADDAGAIEGTGSFKEESNLVADLPDPEKKALDEFKQLIVAALAAGDFNLPPPPPPPKAKAEATAEETKTEAPSKEEAKTEEPAKEEPKTEAAAEAATEEPKAEAVAEEAAKEPKAEEPAKEETKAEAVAEEAKPEPEPEKTVMVTEEETTKTVEAIEETVVPIAAASEEAAAPEAEAQAAAPEPVLIWGVPLVGDDERTDTVLLKFLRAREFKVKEAMAMLKSAVLWRKRFGIESLLDADLGLPELDKVVFYRGADREGHPVCYNVYGEFQDKELYEKAFGDEEKRERFLKWRIQLLERGILSQLDFAPSGICSMYGLVHISAGDLLRAEIAAGTENGKRAKEFMEKGQLVPNEIVVNIVKERLLQPDAQEKGWLLDGYPRSCSQAMALETLGIRPDIFILLDVPDEILVERVVGRRLDPVTGKIYHLKYSPPENEEIASRLTLR